MPLYLLLGVSLISILFDSVGSLPIAEENKSPGCEKLLNICDKVPGHLFGEGGQGGDTSINIGRIGPILLNLPDCLIQKFLAILVDYNAKNGSLGVDGVVPTEKILASSSESEVKDTTLSQLPDEKISSGVSDSTVQEESTQPGTTGNVVGTTLPVENSVALLTSLLQALSTVVPADTATSPGLTDQILSTEVSKQVETSVALTDKLISTEVSKELETSVGLTDQSLSTAVSVDTAASLGLTDQKISTEISKEVDTTLYLTDQKISTEVSKEVGTSLGLTEQQISTAISTEAVTTLQSEATSIASTALTGDISTAANSEKELEHSMHADASTNSLSENSDKTTLEKGTDIIINSQVTTENTVIQTSAHITEAMTSANAVQTEAASAPAIASEKQEVSHEITPEATLIQESSASENTHLADQTVLSTNNANPALQQQEKTMKDEATAPPLEADSPPKEQEASLPAEDVKVTSVAGAPEDKKDGGEVPEAVIDAPDGDQLILSDSDMAAILAAGEGHGDMH